MHIKMLVDFGDVVYVWASICMCMEIHQLMDNSKTVSVEEKCIYMFYLRNTALWKDLMAVLRVRRIQESIAPLIPAVSVSPLF